MSSEPNLGLESGATHEAKAAAVGGYDPIARTPYDDQVVRIRVDSDQELVDVTKEEVEGLEKQQESDPAKSPKPSEADADHVYTEFDLSYLYDMLPEQQPLAGIRQWCSKAYQDFDVLRFLVNRVPIIKQFRKGYSLSSFTHDLIVGVTITVVILPQSLAYAKLAGVPLSYALFACFVPLLLYSFFGSVKELSLGPFAIVCLVLQQGMLVADKDYKAAVDADDSALADIYAVRVAMGITLISGFYLLLMAGLQLGWIITLFSRPAIAGFICASSIIICTTQIATVVQVNVHPTSSFIEYWDKIIHAIPHANGCAVLVGVLTIFFLHLADLCFKPPKYKIQPPFPLLVVILTTLISYLAGFHDRFNAKIVGDIGNNFPTPAWPSIPYFADYLVGAIPVTLVNFLLAASIMAQLANDTGAHMDYNQELFAFGITSIVGSIFKAYVPGTSLSRSAVIVKLGPATTVWNLIVFALMALCIGALGQFLYHLPNATLAGIILVAFKSNLARLAEPYHLWHVAPIDSILWILPFLATLFISTEGGLITAALASLIVLLYSIARPSAAVLGQLPQAGSQRIPSPPAQSSNSLPAVAECEESDLGAMSRLRFTRAESSPEVTENLLSSLRTLPKSLSSRMLYRDVARYPQAKELDNILIFRFNSQLCFLNESYFYYALEHAILAKQESGKNPLHAEMQRFKNVAHFASSRNAQLVMQESRQGEGQSAEARAEKTSGHESKVHPEALSLATHESQDGGHELSLLRSESVAHCKNRYDEVLNDPALFRALRIISIDEHLSVSSPTSTSHHELSVLFESLDSARARFREIVEAELDPKYGTAVVLDCSAISSVDTTAYTALRKLFKSFPNVLFLFSDCNPSFRAAVIRSNLLKNPTAYMLPTIQDAVDVASACLALHHHGMHLRLEALLARYPNIYKEYLNSLEKRNP